MGLTSALNTSLNGLSLIETQIDVLGNNIANAGTTGFKASKVLFSTQLARTLSVGSRPTGTNGGTNPRQIGLGASVAQIIPDFSPGSITPTTSPSDLAIQGDGFFIVNTSAGNVYTRNGNFRLDSGSYLSNSQGQRLMGYGVDSNFNLVSTTLAPLSIPIGGLHLAQQTRDVVVGGALSPQGAIGTHGTTQLSEAMVDTTNTAITAGTLLSNVRKPGALATPLFSSGDEVTYAPVKGGRTMETKAMTVTATTTVQDWMDFMTQGLGLQTSGVPTDADSIAVGATVTAGGEIQIKGNRGTVNDFELPVSTIRSNGTPVSINFTRQGSAADGESTVTAFTLYDSLGTPITVRMSAVLESQSNTTTTYRYFLETPSQPGNTIAIGSSTVSFDTLGQVLDSTNNQFAISRAGLAAVDPMVFKVDLSQLSGISSTGSNLNLVSQNGTNPGTLVSFVIDEQGLINGSFDNGIIRTLGQVVMARFSNPEGLLQAGFDNYREGVASGLPQLSTPGAFGTGTIRAGSLELSNTDIGRNLVDLIVASTNYRGNARVISSVDQLVNELLALGR
jgi:flagellar hook protein FlgE